MSEQPKLPNRQTPFSEAFREFIPTGWAPYPDELPEPLPATAFAGARRAAIGAQFPGVRLVIPAGELKVRSNDTDYRFRPHSAFAWLTGLGADREPDAVLVLEPTDAGHEAVLISPDDLASLEDTLELLSDPDAMRQLAEAKRAAADGDYITSDELRSRFSRP